MASPMTNPADLAAIGFFAHRIFVNDDNTLIYEGWAAAHTQTNEKGWRIKKTVITTTSAGETMIDDTWSVGAWDERESLTYQ